MEGRLKMVEQAESAGKRWWGSIPVTLSRRGERSNWRLQVPPEPPLLTDKAVRVVLRDVGLLLDYLNRLPETRLNSYFGPSASAAATAWRPTPPCTSQAYFLGRIAAIAALGADAKPDTVTEPPGLFTADPTSKADPAGHGGGDHLADLAFLLWSCDFLAAVARPATVDTIRVTRAFRAGRMMRRVGVKSEPATSDTADERDLFMSRYGIAIAKRVGWFQRLAMLLLWFSLYLSFMVYSGQVLMHENVVLQADQAALEGRVKEAATQDEALVQAALRAASPADSMFLARGYCDERSPLQPGVEPEPVRIAALSGGATLTVLPSGTARDDHPVKLRLYVSDRQRALCEELAKLERRERELKGMHASWLGVALPVFISTAPWALLVRPPQDNSNPAALELETHRYGMQQVINGLLAGIMPAVYAALGALTSLFRRLTRKAEDERLGPADYGGMMSSLVLGGLTGAVIGLFANIVPHGGQNAGLPLTTTALALLAGYAADRVFAMFDGLAERVFVVPDTHSPKRE